MTDFSLFAVFAFGVLMINVFGSTTDRMTTCTSLGYPHFSFSPYSVLGSFNMILAGRIKYLRL
jgi:hypothetical protein